MNRLSLLSFIFGLVGIIIVLFSLFNVSFPNPINILDILIFLPFVGVILGIVSFFQKPKKKDKVFTWIGIVLGIVYSAFASLPFVLPDCC